MWLALANETRVWMRQACSGDSQETCMGDTKQGRCVLEVSGTASHRGLCRPLWRTLAITEWNWSHLRNLNQGSKGQGRVQAFPGDGGGVNPPTEPSLMKDFLIFQIILSCRQVENQCFREARGPVNRRETYNPYLKLHFYCFPNRTYKWQLTIDIGSSPASHYTGPLEGHTGERPEMPNLPTRDAYWLL